MKIFLIGGGGREHAMAVAILGSPLCKELWVATDNPAITKIAQTINIKPDDIRSLTAFAQDKKIDFVVAGAELPLTLGIYDAMTAVGIACLGPSKAGAVLEGSKATMKKLLVDCGVPTAQYQSFNKDEISQAKDFAYQLSQHNKSVVIKTDGLAQGKGVIIAYNNDEAQQTIDQIFLGQKFGSAGDNIVIEEFLKGRELSYFVITDGQHGVFMGSAEDHKQAYDHDQGPNTGGMGAFAPSPILTPALQKKIDTNIVMPVIKGMESIGYMGILFFGLMICDDEPYLLEINVRLGDPEALVLLATMQTDFLTTLLSAEAGALQDYNIKHWQKTSLAVVLASQGYPAQPMKGQVITLPSDQIIKDSGCQIFHAGTKLNPEGKLIAHGGRVLTVVGTGDDMMAVREKVYGLIDKIDFPDSFYRHDIGLRNNNEGAEKK